MSGFGLIDKPIASSFGEDAVRTKNGKGDIQDLEDLLQLDNYYNGLANFIGGCAMPMTVAVQGDWGTGKTSAMNSIVRILSNKPEFKDSCTTVFFNTWQYSQFEDGQNLVFSLIMAIIKKIAEQKSGVKPDKLKKTLIKVCNVFARVSVSVASEVLGGSTPANIITEILKEGYRAATEGNENGNAILKIDYANELVELRHTFNDLVNEFCEGKGDKRIVVFIDDLDRLQPSRAVEVMEALKVLLESDKCVFVLAIDFDVVVRGVRDKYGADMDERKARAFFDKIIQVPFQMPVNVFETDKMINDALRGLNIEGQSPLYNKFANLSVGSNPRSIKRLLNTFKLSMDIQGCQKRESWSAKHNLYLFAALCLQTSFPELYKLIVQNPQIINRLREHFSHPEVTEDNFLASYEEEQAKRLFAELGSYIDELDLERAYHFLYLLTNSISDPESLKSFEEALNQSTITSRGGAVKPRGGRGMVYNPEELVDR